MSSIARRYAGALLEIATERKLLPRIAEELQQFRDALHASPELDNVLSIPGLAADQRAQLLRSLLDDAGASETCRNFLLLLSSRGRLDHLDAILAYYREGADKAAGVVRAKVTSAAPLSDRQQKNLIEALKTSTGKQVTVEAAVDPSLLGGVITEIGSLVYDGSLKGQLRRLQRELAQHSGSPAE